MSEQLDEPHQALASAIQPLVDRIGGTIIPMDQARAGDVVVHWANQEAFAVRLPEEEISTALDRMIAQTETELGGQLNELSRSDKQQAVRILEDRGAFSLRKSVESIANALGVSRFTVYNYLNRT